MHVISSHNPEGEASTFTPAEWRNMVRSASDLPLGHPARVTVLRFQTCTPPALPHVPNRGATSHPQQP